MPRPLSLHDLRRYAISRSLFKPTSLKRALLQLGFVQADPIRAPARAQDLILRHRVRNYRAGDLERRYARDQVEEDFFVNYGFMPADQHALMLPRSGVAALTPLEKKQAALLLAFVREHGEAHPREVEAHFSHGTVANYWGGTSNATTHLLGALHYRGFLRIVRRDAGIRVYALRASSARAALSVADLRQKLDALVDLAVGTYAPLPVTSLARLVSRLRYAVPQWRSELPPALARAKARLDHVSIDGRNWYWPRDERLSRNSDDEQVRLLAPFDPVVWDRQRFEIFWGWAYRFEAYTPLPKRKLGYYALPLLWRDQVVGWANLAFSNGELSARLGYVAGRAPRDLRFKSELERELERMRRFLQPRGKR